MIFTRVAGYFLTCGVIFWFISAKTVASLLMSMLVTALLLLICLPLVSNSLSLLLLPLVVVKTSLLLLNKALKLVNKDLGRIAAAILSSTLLSVVKVLA